MGEADGAAVVRDHVRDLVLADLLLSDFAKLELSLLAVNSVGLETTLNVVKHAEVLSGLLDAHYVHEAEGVSVVAPPFIVHFDVVALVLADLDALLAGERVLKSVLEQVRQR